LPAAGGFGISARVNAPAVSPADIAPRAGWDQRLVHGACALLALTILVPHFFGAFAAVDDAPFSLYFRKYCLLRAEPDAVRRDWVAIPSSGNFRRIDRLLAPEARLFASGLIGEANGRRLGNFFFAVYYLFPRTIDASLDELPRFTSGGWLEGRDCSSQDSLRARGYHVHLDFSIGTPESEQMRFTWLTTPPARRPGPGK
jgi:hypothetical protein